MAIEKYIFNGDAKGIFYEKLENLHDKYVHYLLLSGIAPNGTGLESIKMTKSPRINDKHCQRVIGGLKNVTPQIIARLIEDESTKIECVFTHINDNENINFLYMIQNVIDWPQIDSFSCQVWCLGGDSSVGKVKELWNE